MITAATMNTIKRIDWVELREQKRELAACGIKKDWVEGLLNLIDHIQDAAVEDGVASETDVFGEQHDT